MHLYMIHIENKNKILLLHCHTQKMEKISLKKIYVNFVSSESYELQKNIQSISIEYNAVLLKNKNILKMI